MNNRSLSQRTRKPYGQNKYRGVTWHKRHKHWQVSIKVDGVNKYFGNFDSEEDGLEAVNNAYAEYFPDNPELQQLTQQKMLVKENDLICRKW